MNTIDNKFRCLELMGYTIRKEPYTFMVLFKIIPNYSIIKRYKNEIMDENFIIEKIVNDMNEEIKKYVNHIRP